MSINLQSIFITLSIYKLRSSTLQLCRTVLPRWPGGLLGKCSLPPPRLNTLCKVLLYHRISDNDLKTCKIKLYPELRIVLDTSAIRAEHWQKTRVRGAAAARPALLCFSESVTHRQSPTAHFSQLRLMTFYSNNKSPAFFPRIRCRPGAWCSTLHSLSRLCRGSLEAEDCRMLGPEWPRNLASLARSHAGLSFEIDTSGEFVIV